RSLVLLVAAAGAVPPMALVPMAFVRGAASVARGSAAFNHRNLLFHHAAHHASAGVLFLGGNAYRHHAGRLVGDSLGHHAGVFLDLGFGYALPGSHLAGFGLLLVLVGAHLANDRFIFTNAFAANLWHLHRHFAGHPDLLGLGRGWAARLAAVMPAAK